MAKKINNSRNNERPVFMMPKDQAINLINERIALGDEILNRQIISDEELQHERAEYYKWSSYNKELLLTMFSNSVLADEYSWFVGIASAGGSRPILSEEIKDLRKDILEKIRRLDSIKERIPLFQEDTTIQQIGKGDGAKMNQNNSVFIVHGHDEAFKQSVARVIERLGLEAIILHERPNAGLTVIEKLESYSNVGFALVLLSPDDEGKSIRETNLKPRARQNVIAELGYFVGKLGRKNVCPLYKEGVDIPSDFSGVLYVPYDDAGQWRFSLLSELRAAGYSVDANRLV